MAVLGNNVKDWMIRGQCFYLRYVYGQETPSETTRAQGGEGWTPSMNPQGIVLPHSKVWGFRVFFE
jgi:hypothetical protein